VTGAGGDAPAARDTQAAVLDVLSAGDHSAEPATIQRSRRGGAGRPRQAGGRAGRAV